MQLVWFLLGLALGLSLLWSYHRRFHVRLNQILQELEVPSLKSSVLASLLRVTTAIQHQRQFNLDLEQRLETWKQILQAAPIGYLEVDEHNQLCWSNVKACQLLGIDWSQATSYQARLLLQYVRSYELDQLIAEVRSTQQPCERDWVFHPSPTHPLGPVPELPLRGHSFPLPLAHVGVFLENRQEAITLTEERDRWASDVAHELKTPLTSIRLVAETLQGRLDPSLRTWIDRLLNEVIRLSILVQDLLDLSQMTLRPQALNLATLDLPKLIRSAWLSLEPLSRKKQLQLAYEGPETLLLLADEARLYRVLLNLLDNSIKYSPANAAILVAVQVLPPATGNGLLAPNLLLENQPFLRIDVIDSGPGFAEATLPYVFERFYRGDPARVRPLHTEAALNAAAPFMPQTGAGSGLGLAIVRQIIENHGGSVKASNHPETGGAWLQVFLPWRSPPLKPPTHQP